MTELFQPLPDELMALLRRYMLANAGRLPFSIDESADRITVRRSISITIEIGSPLVSTREEYRNAVKCNALAALDRKMIDTLLGTDAKETP